MTKPMFETGDFINPMAMKIIDIASGGARDYFRAKNVDVKSVDLGALADALKHYITESWSTAIKDAEDAMACNMPQIAEVTFAATFKVAGIAAAKHVLGEISA